ncbi:MAG TPA: alpha/beta fold hydrolase [Gemmatimonadaceae bacterium]|nr:alpha/beta fold hydrolase [Gemmatimonadaceae bacterium]
MPKKIIRRSETIELAGAKVPSILLLPDGSGPFPAVLLLHGYSSSKHRLAESMGQPLAVRGIASLSIDLPLHGSRDDAIIREARTNPLGLIQHWNMALAEARAAVRWLREHETIDAQQISVAGYSLGSYIALQTAGAGDGVASVIVAAGGDLPVTPWTNMVRMAVDPLKSVKSLNGRPLLMLHGRFDRTITAEQAQRLYDAAAEPKELRWYNSGHVLPVEAAKDAATWLGKSFVRSEK